MSKVWAWAVGILMAVCIIGLIVTPQAPRNSKGAVYVIVRGGTQQQADTQAPEGHWLLVRRIPRP
jgi:hypothetical protein